MGRAENVPKARGVLRRAIEAEVGILLDAFDHVRLLDGRRAVVHKRYLPSREILTGIGSVPVRVLKVRDRSGSGVKVNCLLAPPYVRRSPRVSAALPWLYLKRVSSGDPGAGLVRFRSIGLGLQSGFTQMRFLRAA